MKTTLVNITLEWLNVPAAGRFEFSHTEVVGGSLIIGWGDLSLETYELKMSSAGGLCRMCFALRAEGGEDDIQAEARFTDTDRPFEFSVAEVLRQDREELRLEEPGVKVVAEIDYFAML